MKRCLAIAVLLCASVIRAGDPPRSEYRAYWVDTFHTPLGTHHDVDRIVEGAIESNANALFVQVRRRADAWYLDSSEPLTETAGVGEPDASGRWTFDPLSYLIEQAHMRGIEVHAFVIAGSIFRSDPKTEVLPRDPRHVFLQHFWDAANQMPYSDARQWATRALPHNAAGTSYNGNRFGDEWYIDFGHPAAAAYTLEVLLHLVRAYDLDGLHLDRIRYPEAPVDRGKGERMGANVGYNDVSVARFKARYGDAARYYTRRDIGKRIGGHRITEGDVGYPRSNDPLWSDWRREQVTSFVRRLYLSAMAIRPSIRISAALISWGAGPSASGGFEKTDSYNAAFQDWSGWLREGIIDMASPMMYKREHSPRERSQFDDWLGFLVARAHASGREAVPGIGAYLNSIEGTLRQARRARTAGADGVIFFAMGDTKPWSIIENSTNRAVSRNPYALPVPGVPTPKRPNEEFFAALRSGTATDGRTEFERMSAPPLFAAGAPPLHKPIDATGAVMGLATRNGMPLDGAAVTIESADTHEVETARTDGNGFFGLLKLAPGEYRASVRVNGEMTESSVFQIHAGAVAEIALSSR